MQKFEDSVISGATASTGVGTLSISEESLKRGSSFAQKLASQINKQFYEGETGKAIIA
jgi:hypothetical protein